MCRVRARPRRPRRAPRAPRLSTRTPPPEDTLAGPLGLAVAPCTAQVHVQSARQRGPCGLCSVVPGVHNSAPRAEGVRAADRVETGARLYLFKIPTFN